MRPCNECESAVNQSALRMRACRESERAMSKRADALGLLLDVEPGLLFSGSDALTDLRFIRS